MFYAPSSCANAGRIFPGKSLIIITQKSKGGNGLKFLHSILDIDFLMQAGRWILCFINKYQRLSLTGVGVAEEIEPDKNISANKAAIFKIIR
jgi:hypothetical protein